MPCGPPSTELANTRKGKLSNTGDRVGTRTQQPGRRGRQQWREGARGEQRADGGWRDSGGGVPSGGQSAAQHARQLARGRPVGTAAFSRSPALPWPDPYLTLVRPLRSVHLLDMSIQVIRPGKEREPRQTLKSDLRKGGCTLGQTGQPCPNPDGEHALPPYPSPPPTPPA